MKRVKLFGPMAVAARRLGVGMPIRGQGSICQEVSEEYVGRIKTEAGRMAKDSLAGVKQEKPEIDTSKFTQKGGLRTRYESNREKALPIIRQMLIDTRGLVRNEDIVKALHEAGTGISKPMLAQVRRELGLPKRPGTPAMTSIAAGLAAAEAYREQQATPEPAAPTEAPVPEAPEPPVPVLPSSLRTNRGEPRQRRPHDYEAAKRIAFQMLAEAHADGRRVMNYEIRRAVHAQGIGLGDPYLRTLRKAWERHVRYCKQRNLPLGAQEVGQQEQSIVSKEEPQEVHPLANLITNLAENFGLVYLHWEKGGELVIREAQERRFKI